MTTPESKLRELYPILQECIRLDDDLNIYVPNDHHDHYHICCEQKIILWKDDRYVMVCLYNSHPSLEFKTIEEVKNFYDGLNSRDLVYQSPSANHDGSQKLTPAQIAYNAGIYVTCVAISSMTKCDFQSAVSTPETIFLN